MAKALALPSQESLKHPPNFVLKISIRQLQKFHSGHSGALMEAANLAKQKRSL